MTATLNIHVRLQLLPEAEVNDLIRSYLRAGIEKEVAFSSGVFAEIEGKLLVATHALDESCQDYFGPLGTARG
jgi:hypothetical protein